MLAACPAKDEYLMVLYEWVGKCGLLETSLVCSKANFEFLFGALIDLTVVVSSHIFTQ